MEQQSLFPIIDHQFFQPHPPPTNQHAVEVIRGLRYVSNYITEFQHDWLLNEIEKHEWGNFYQRRIQHYGESYYRDDDETDDERSVTEMPEWLKRLCLKLHTDGYMPVIANQALVSEYEPGQGIGSHIDKEACHMDTIISLSLGSSCVMELTNQDDESQKVPIWLAPRSIAVLSEDAKTQWMHGIPSRKTDVWEGRKYERGRRVSITFRSLM